MIVTVSTGVLAKEVIRFSPELPWPVRDAIHRLPMGKSNKAALLFHKDLFGLPDRAYLHFLPKLAPALDLDFEKRGKRVVVTGHFAGALSDRLEGREMVGALKSALVELFGSGVIRFCKRSVCTAWGKDPLFFGAYSAAAPGGAAGRQTLATPVDERVIFAGEATSTDAYATAHGAYQSGVRAASFCLSVC